jgi:hypothetical protein
MKTDEARRGAIIQELSELLLFRGSDSVRQLVRLLDALIEDTLADLAFVDPANLQRKQGALAQLMALRRSIVDPGDHASPKA